MSASGGYGYAVSEAQRRTFAAQSDEAKLAWLDEWSRATYEAATPAVRRAWWRLRGQPIPDHPDFRDPPAP